MIKTPKNRQIIKEVLSCLPTESRFKNWLMHEGQKFFYKGNLDNFFTPCVEVILSNMGQNGLRANMVIDTGCFDTYISTEIVEQLGLILVEGETAKALGLDEHIYESKIYSGCNIIIESEAKPLSCIGRICSSSRPLQHDGILGTAFLKGLGLKFTYNPNMNSFTLEQL
jgi:hypothetical protein